MENVKPVVIGDRVYRPVLDETVTQDDIRKAQEELNETPETRERALKVLKKMLCDQNEFTPRTDDVYLLRFLRCRKFDCDRTFKAIKEHYKFRYANPKVFPAPSAVEHALRANIYNFLPHRDHHGRAIYLVKAGRWNTDTTSHSDNLAAGNLVAEYVLDNTVTQINGYIGIWDFKGFTMKQFLSICNPKNIMLLTTLMQDRFPGRFKMAYCVNCHYLTETGWKIFKPILKEKFRNRIQILGPDINELHKYVSPSILPPEYNGTMTYPETQQIAKGVLDKENYVNYNRKFGY